MKCECFLHTIDVDDDCMSGIVTSGTTSTYVDVGSQDVYQLSFTFIAPLCSKDNRN